MGQDPELTDGAMQAEIELLADLMTAATATEVLTPTQVDDALGVVHAHPAEPEVAL